MRPTPAAVGDHPLLVGDPAALRQRIQGLTGRWRDRWQRFCTEALAEQRQDRWYASGKTNTPLHAALIAVATGEQQFIDIARRDLAHLVDRYEATLAVGNQDMDTWIHAAPMARRAIAVDWMWPWLSAAERTQLTDLLVRDSLRYAYVVLHHRIPPHANNQGAALALNLVTVGAIFGVRRGDDPRAKHLLATGLPHLLQQIALLPPGGYGGEGSAYEVGVAAPLLALCCAVAESVTGANLFDRPLGASGNTYARTLQLGRHLVSPGGLLPAWDQHGFQHSRPGTADAWLAYRSGDPSWYDADAWALGGGFAWLRDDHVWQWLWMPDHPLPRTTAQPWAEERVGGAVVGGGLHLFQHWDVVGQLPVRAHCNPNAIQLEAFGSLLTVDGNPAEGYALAADPRLQLTWWACDPPQTISWAGGSIASHSCVCIDDRIDLRGPDAGIAPDPAVVGAGHLLRLESRPGFSVVAADAAACYRGGFDLRHAIRSSAVIDDTFWVAHDDLEDVVPHAWRWQLVLRAGAVPTPWGVRLTTAEHVVLDVVPLEGAAAGTLVDIAGYPSLLERRCHHYRREQHGTSAAWTTVLIPRLARQQLAVLSDGWTTTWDGCTPGSIDVETMWLQATEHPDAACTWERDLELPGGDDLLLELPRTDGLEVFLDDQPLAMPAMAHFHTGEQVCQTPFVPLPAGAARSVRLRLRFTSPGRFAALGGVALHRRLAIAPPVVTTDGDRLEVTINGRTHAVELAAVRTTPRPAPAASPGGEDPLAVAADLLAPLRLDHTAADPFWWNGSDSDRARACCAAILRGDRTAEPQLLPLLADKDWDVRLTAAAALVHLGTATAIPALTAALAAESPERVADHSYGARYRVREMCLLALQRIGDPSTRPLFERCLIRGEFYGVRRLAAQALQNLGTPASLDALRAWVTDADAETASACRTAIALITARTSGTDRP